MKTTRFLLAARAALGMSLLLLGSTASRASFADPVTAASGQLDLVLPEAAVAQRLSEPAISLAAETDPFRADRSRAPSRYRLPGEAETGTDASAPEAEPAPAVTLLGTVVLSEGRGVALLHYGTDAPRLVRVGETIGTLTLRTVKPGHASLADADGSVVEVSVARPRY